MTAIDREILELKMKAHSEGLTYEEFQRWSYLMDKKRLEKI